MLKTVEDGSEELCPLGWRWRWNVGRTIEDFGVSLPYLGWKFDVCDMTPKVEIPEPKSRTMDTIHDLVQEY